MGGWDDETITTLNEINTDVEYIRNEKEHLSSIFPKDSNEIVTFAASLTANTWSKWHEIVDNNASSLSVICASCAVHLSSVVVENAAESGAIFMSEIGYDSGNALVTPFRVKGGSVPKQETKVPTPAIPMGKTIVYRMKATVGNATLTVHFRHHRHV